MNKRYTWVGTAVVGSAVIGGGVAMYEGSQNRKSAKKAQDDYNAQVAANNARPDFIQLPGYAESDAARGNWWQTLQDWGGSGTYGANLPNYDKVFENAKNRINQYYWGGPSNGGLIDKIRAGAARRNVSDSPATDVLTQRAGAEQAGKLADISTNLDVTKAGAVETARNNWLNSIMSLSNLKPAYMSPRTGQMGQYGAAPLNTGLGETITTAGTGVANYYQNKQDQDWYKNLLDQYTNSGHPMVTQSSLTNTGTTTQNASGGFDTFYE